MSAVARVVKNEIHDRPPLVVAEVDGDGHGTFAIRGTRGVEREGLARYCKVPDRTFVRQGSVTVGIGDGDPASRGLCYDHRKLICVFSVSIHVGGR